VEEIFPIVFILVTVLAVCAFIISSIKNALNLKTKEYENLLQENYQQSQKIRLMGTNIETINRETRLEVEKLNAVIQKKDELHDVLNGPLSVAFSKVARFISDYQTLHFEECAKILENKKHPAKIEAKRIRELKSEYRTHLEQSKVLEYQLEKIFEIFPELEAYFENLDELQEANSIREVHDGHDRVRDYLSAEEYETLSITDKNQLALDRYIKRKKTNSQIGRDYEMSVGAEYEQNGWLVEYTGMKYKLSDLGRDLVATKDDEIHVVQCKYWALRKKIHEKHIAQLYGTTKVFEFEKADLFSKVTPVFVTNIKLSKTAKDFARKLGVKLVEKRELNEFPRIKCNNSMQPDGTVEKIYHLPIDQQYNKTLLNKPGDCYTTTVAEAEGMGFRRAYKWNSERE